MARSVYREIPCELAEGDTCNLVIASLQTLLQFACSRASAWAEIMREVASAARCRGQPLKLLLFMDECRGGNILAPLPTNKICFFHISLAEFPPRHLLSAASWLPFAVVPSMVADELEGGMSRAARAVLSQLSDNNLRHVRIFDDVYADFVMHACVADMEGMRQLYASKGAAALRPCLLCANVVKKDSGLAAPTNGLVEILAHDRGLFRPVSDADLFDYCDRLARHPPTRQKDLVRLEQTSGVVFDSSSLLFDPQTRATLPPSRVIYDPLHCYFQGGVAAVEAACLVTALTERADCGLAGLAAAATSVAWLTSGSASRQAHGAGSAAYRKRLFNPKLWSERMFRGEVKELRSLLPLLYFLADRRSQELNVLSAEMKSMQALMDLLHLGQHSSAVLTKILRS